MFPSNEENHRYLHVPRGAATAGTWRRLEWGPLPQSCTSAEGNEGTNDPYATWDWIQKATRVALNPLFVSHACTRAHTHTPGSPFSGHKWLSLGTG